MRSAPGLARESGREVGDRLEGAGGVRGVVAEEDGRQERRVLDAAGEGPDLVERRREGHEAVAAHATVGGLQAHDAAERRGLADRAARVRAEGERGHPAATAAAEPPEDPPGTRPRSQGFRVVLYALFSVEEPIANSSMFVLPRTTAPAFSSRATAVEVKGGR